MVWGLPCFAIRRTTSYYAEYRFVEGTKQTNKVAFLLNLSLFPWIQQALCSWISHLHAILESVSCSLSFASVRPELLNLALQIIHVNLYCTYSFDHFLFYPDIVWRDWKIRKKFINHVQSRQSQVNYWAHQVPCNTYIKTKLWRDQLQPIIAKQSVTSRTVLVRVNGTDTSITHTHTHKQNVCLHLRRTLV